MSKTRTFKMGHAEVFQDKQSEETRKILHYMEENNFAKARKVLGTYNGLSKIALDLSTKKDGEISVVLSALVNEIRYFQTKENS